mmetsp:Transcript_23176/g.35874  ORF Transcript_23176/g.35874 Transcript_23176/m.35874 type:complete len:176 (-) Transcript_23176:27-554(-)
MGNTNIGKQWDVKLDYDDKDQKWMDLRVFYAYYLKPDDFNPCRFTLGDDPDYYVLSEYNDSTPICYTTEALKYAQTVYLVCAIMFQVINYLVVRTRVMSAFSVRFSNTSANFFMIFHLAIAFVLVYVPSLNYDVLNLRDVPIIYMGVPVLPFMAALLLWSELVKAIRRRKMNPAF